MNLPAIYEPQGRQALLRSEDSGYATEEEGINLRLLVALLLRRREIVFLTLALCVVLAMLFTSAQPRIYGAAADVVLVTQGINVAPDDQDPGQDGSTRPEAVDTQIQLIRSREMARQVLVQSGLEEDMNFRADVLDPRTVWDNLLGAVGWSRSGDNLGAATSDDGFQQRAVSYLIRRLTVIRVGNSLNLRIAYIDTDPQRTAHVANAYARLYTLDDVRERARSSAGAAETLRAKVDELRQAANAAYGEVQAYRVANGLISSAATSLTEQEISTYNQQVAVARAEAARDAAALASARGQLASGGAGNVGSAAGSGVIGNLRAQRAQLVIKERDLSQRYFDDNPDLVTVRRQITDLDRQIESEVTRSIQGLRTEAQASAQRLSSLLASRNSTRAQLGTNNTALVKLADLEKKADAAQTLYRSYLEQFNKVVAGSGTERPAARLISAANVPVQPTSPRLLLNLALGLVVGLCAGAMLAILAELSYRGFTTIEDVERRLGVFGLGSVPAHDTVDPHADTPLDSVRDFPDGPFSEALRNVIVSLRNLPGGGARVIAMASAVPGEGKSTLSACLGRSLASAGVKVLVIDCDVIRAQLSAMFGFAKSDPGLREALHSQRYEFACHTDAETAMRIVPITEPFAKGERLTERGRLGRMIACLREEYDVIILDCPPVLPIAETREIIASADATLLVVSWRHTTDRVVKAALRLLPSRSVRELGIVLNRVDMRKQVRFGGDDAASFYKHYSGYYQ